MRILSVFNAGADTDRFLVQDGTGAVKFRTGAEVAADIGAANIAASQLRHTVKAAVALTKGQAVYVSGADGTNMLVSKSSNVSESTSTKTMGLIDRNLAINDMGEVITEGLLAGLNTSTATIGDPVWLGVDGNLLYGLANKPVAPAHMVFIGIVTRVQTNNGEIFVKVQNGFELEELHNVLITGTPVDKAVIQYDTASGLWKNSTLAGVTASTGTAGQVAYFTGATTQAGNNNLFWDATNFRLGIGTNTPTRKLQVEGTGFFADNLQVQKDFIGATTIRVGNLGTIDAATLMQFALSEDGSTVNGYFRRYRNGTGLTEIGFSNALAFTGAVTGTPVERIRIDASGNFIVDTNTLFVDAASNRVGIGTVSPSSKLDIVGSLGSFRVLDSGAEVYFTRDGNNDLYANAGTSAGLSIGGRSYLRFFTGSASLSERMRIDPNGNIGIGTTSPIYKLDVQGTWGTVGIRSLSNTAGDILYYATGTVTGQLNAFTTSINATGSVAATLLNGNTATGSAFLDINVTSTSTGDPYLSLTTSGATNWSIGIDNSDSDKLKIGPTSNPSIGTPSLTIDTTGNIGIGTTAPTERLVVRAIGNSYANSAALSIENNTGANKTYLTNANGVFYISNSTSVDHLILYANGNFAVDTSTLFVDATNNRVGIGTATPTSTFVIVGSGARGGTATGASIRINNTTTSRFSFLEYDDSQNFSFWNGNDGVTGGNFIWYNSTGSGTERMRLDGTGRLGIGTNNPSYTFHAVSADATIGAFRNSGAALGQLLVGNTAGDMILRILATGDSLIYSDTAKYLAFGSNGGTERMRIDTAGNVGIGVTAPNVRLDVNGSLDLRNAFQGYARLQPSAGNTSQARLSIRLKPVDTAEVTLGSFTQDGSFGLGGNITDIISMAGAYFSVASTGRAKLNSYGVGTFSGTVAYNLAVDASGNIIETAGGVVDGSGTANYIPKWQDANTLTNSLIFDNGTNVGIGTASPLQKLDVRDGMISVQRNSDSSVVNFNIFSGVTPVSAFQINTDHTNLLSTITSRNSYVLSLATNDTERMRITSAGNVGIGLTDPSAKLHITGEVKIGGDNGAANTRLTRINFIRSVYDPTGVGASIDFYREGSASEGALAFSTNPGTPGNNAAERIRILANGNVGISTTTPSAKLDVFGVTGQTLIRAVGADTNGNADAEIKSTGTLGSSRIYFSDTDALSGSIIYSHGSDAMTFSTLSVERMRINSAGDLLVNQTAASNAMIFASTTGKTNVVAIRAGGNATQATSYGFFANQAVNSSNSVEYASFISSIDINSGTYTIPDISNYIAQSATKPVGVTITNMYGFRAQSGLTQGTNNFGFRGDIPAGTGRWNLYMNGTAENYLAGSLGIGINSLTGYNLRINKAITGTPYPFSFAVSGAVQSDVTNIATYVHAISSTQAATFTLPQIILFNAEQGTFGANSVVTTQTGFNVTNLSGATNNVGFSGNLSSGTGKWNLYMGGTANNYMAGALGVGTTTMTYLFNVVNTGATYVAGFRGGSNSYIVVGDTSLAGESGVNLRNSSGQGFLGLTGQILGLAATSGANTITLSTAGTERMRVDVNGNIGIGTTNILDHLFVSKATGSSIGIGMGGAAGTVASPIYTYLNFRGYGDAIKAQLSSYDVSSNVVGGMLAFSVQNTSAVLTEYMRITSTGNVGIGTASPSSSLQINKSAQTIGGTTPNGALIVSSLAAGNAILEIGVAPTFLSYIQSRNVISNTVYQLLLNPDGGNVGIGTNSPSSTLHVSRNSATFQVSDTAKTANNTLSIFALTQTSWAIGTGASGTFSSSEKIVITDGGNIGIGTGTPSGKIHVIGTESRFGGVASGFISLYNATNRSGYIQANQAVDLRIASDTDPMTFYVGGSERMRISTAGNLIIGSTSAGANGLLQVNGSIGLGQNTEVRQSTNGDGGTLRFLGTQFVAASTNSQSYGYTGGGLIAGITASDNAVLLDVGRVVSTDARFKIINSTSGNATLSFGTSTTSTLFATTVGNVGIGTASINASAKLQVDSTTQGFLPPRMTATQRAAISTPAEGLIIFQTDGVVGLYLYVNSAWKSLAIVN